jgi:hypothetical protein
MDNQTLQELISRVGSLEAQISKDSFSAVDIYRKYIDVANRLKIPVVATNPTIGNVGDIVCVVTTFKMCTVASLTAPTWTALLSATGDGSSLTNINIIRTMTAGPAITAGDVVCIGPYQSDGGITLDAKGTANASKSFNITVGNNSNRILVVFVAGAGHASADTATYASVSMTRITTATYGAIFYLVAPATGTNTFALTSVDAAAGFSCAWYSCYNAKQTGQPDASLCDAGDAAVSISTVLNGCLVLCGAAGSSIASSDCPYESQTVGGITTGSSGIVYPAGTTINLDLTNGGSNPVSQLFSIAPATAVTENVIQPASASNVNNQYFKPYNNVVGIAPSAISATASGTVYLGGVVTGLTGLSTTNKIYYLSNTAGLISTTAGTNSKKIGINLSTTSLLLQLS